jgi:hypothetical protein
MKIIYILRRDNPIGRTDALQEFVCGWNAAPLKSQAIYNKAGLNFI